MPESATLEAPAPETMLVEQSADRNALEASFNAAMSDAKGEEPNPEPTKEVEKKVEPPVQKTSKGGVPSSVIRPPTPPQEQQDEPLVTEEVRNNVPKGKARESFATLEAKATAKIKALQAELQDTKAKISQPQIPKDFEENYKSAQQKAAELEQKLERVAYEHSPKYQKFGSEEKAELDTAKSYIDKESGINPSVIEMAASNAGPARIKILRDSGMDAETVAGVTAHLARVDAIRRERDASLDNWKQTVQQDAQVQQQAAKAQEEQRSAQQKQVFDTVRARMSSMSELTKVDGYPEWNKWVDEAHAEAENFFGGKTSLHQLAELGYRGTIQKMTQAMNGELMTENKSLREENTRLKAAQPSTGTPREDTTKRATPDPLKDSTEYHKSIFDQELAKAKGH